MKCLHVWTLKSHIFILLYFCCCLFPHSLLLMALQKKSALWTSLHLSPSLYFYFSLTHHSNPRLWWVLRHQRTAEPYTAQPDCTSPVRDLKDHDIAAQPSDGLQWLWPCCPCLRCCSGQDYERVGFQLSGLCQCGKLKTHSGCKLLTMSTSVTWFSKGCEIHFSLPERTLPDIKPHFLVCWVWILK